MPVKLPPGNEDLEDELDQLNLEEMLRVDRYLRNKAKSPTPSQLGTPVPYSSDSE